MKILIPICFLCLLATACDEDTPANALTPSGVPVCRTYFLPLASYSTEALVAFCDSTIDYPVFVGQRDVTDGELGPATYVQCCWEGYDTILTNHAR